MRTNRCYGMYKNSSFIIININCKKKKITNNNEYKSWQEFLDPLNKLMIDFFNHLIVLRFIRD